MSSSNPVKPASAADVEALALAQRNGWPQDLRVLIERYPRETWAGHDNLGSMARFWLQRHDMFRKLGGMLDDGTAQFREGKIAPADYPKWLAPRLQFFLEQLHVHHRIEDEHYFPIFQAADERLARAFGILEADHEALHRDIARSIEGANAMLRALQENATNNDALSRAGDAYAAASGDLIKGLMRHLEDEEDIIVPLILDRGEDALGVGH